MLSSRSVVLSDKSCIVEREEEFQLGNSQEDRNQEHSSTDITVGTPATSTGGHPDKEPILRENREREFE